MPSPSAVPEALAAAKFNPGNFVFLIAIVFGLTAVASPFACPTRNCDPPTLDLVFQALFAVASFSIALAIGPLRLTLKTFFSRPREPVQIQDVLLGGLLITLWGSGFHSLLVVLPDVAMNGLEAFKRWKLGNLAPTNTLATYAVIFMSSCILAPITEEMLCRGAMLNMWRVHRSLWGAILLSSLVFGLAHDYRTLFAFVAGIVMALMALRYGSLLPVIAAHGIANLLLMYPLLGQVMRLKDPNDPLAWSNWAWEVGFAVLSIPVAILFWRRFRPT